MRIYEDTSLEAANTWTPIERYVLEYPKEKQWQKVVESFFPDNLGFRAYHTWNSIHSTKGFPDLVILHPPSGITLVAEMKLENNKKSRVTIDQIEWLKDASACGHMAFVWRPSEADEIRDVVQAISDRRLRGGVSL